MLLGSMFQALGSIFQAMFPQSEIPIQDEVWWTGHRVMTENTELVSSGRERTLGSLEVDSDHTPGKTAKGARSWTFTNGQKEAVEWVRLLEGQHLTRPAFSNGPVHPLPCGKRGTECGQQKNASKAVYDLIPRSWQYVTLCGKGELRLLISWPWDGKIILGHPGGPKVIRSVFINGRGGQEREDQRDGSTARDSARPCWLWRWKMGTMNQGMWVASKSWKKPWNRFFPSTSRRKAALPNPDFSPVRLLMSRIGK